VEGWETKGKGIPILASTLEINERGFTNGKDANRYFIC